MVSIEKHKYLSLREQSITLVSLFLTHYIKCNNSVQVRTTQYLETKIEQLFFRNESYSFNHLWEKLGPETIHQYLQRFFISEKPYVPLIKIDDTPEQNSFKFQLWVENRKDSMREPLTLNNFIRDRANNKFKASLFQSLASLSRDFTAIKPLISSSGKEQLFFDSVSFEEVLLHILPLVKLSGIRILLPNSLKKPCST